MLYSCCIFHFFEGNPLVIIDFVEIVLHKITYTLHTNNKYLMLGNFESEKKTKLFVIFKISYKL